MFGDKEGDNTYGFHNGSFITNEKSLLKLIINGSTTLRYITRHTEQIIITAIKAYPNNFKYISEDLKIKYSELALGLDGSLIRYLSEPSCYLQRLAVISKSSSIKYIYNPGDNLVDLSISLNGNNIKYIQNPSQGLILKALKQDITAIEHISDNQINDEIIDLVSNISPSTLNGLTKPAVIRIINICPGLIVDIREPTQELIIATYNQR